MSYALTKPRADGFYMPAEWYPHQQTWMLWPERSDNWRDNAKPAQAAFCQVARAIAAFEAVTVGVSPAAWKSAEQCLKHPAIRLLEISNNDAWIRDTGPTFLLHPTGELRGVDWKFNAWGGELGGLYSDWADDDLVASKVLHAEQVQGYRTDDFVLEGGAIHVDGEGTLITTEECLLNKNRNPHLSRCEIERYLCDYLNVSHIIWLPQGLANDETDGHVDNFCCFIAPAQVLLAWTDQPENPNYHRCRDALAILEKSVDAQGRRLTVHKMLLPNPIYPTPEECAQIATQAGTLPRSPDKGHAASYINFLIVNGGIIAPSFDDPCDAPAQALLEQLFPDRQVIMIPSREIILGGGNIHCITQQQPKSLNA